MISGNSWNHRDLEKTIVFLPVDLHEFQEWGILTECRIKR
jgi:hypothetical protein